MAKLPSGRFPFINLGKALARTSQLYQADRGGKGLRMPLAFAAWDYSPKSSGGFQTIGALLTYGLIDDEGSGDERAVRLTANARRYFQSEIEADQAALREQFAKSPKLFAHLLDHWDGSTPPDNVARTYLKTEIGLNEQSARSALSIYKDNLEYVSSKGSAKDASETLNPEENGGAKVTNNGDGERGTVPLIAPKAIEVGDKVQWTSQGVDQFDIPRPVTAVTLVPEKGWFVSIRGEKGAVPMEQVEIIERGTQQRDTLARREDASSATQPIEVFLTAGGRLQITADVDRQGVDTLIDMLEKYKPILDLVGKKPN